MKKLIIVVLALMLPGWAASESLKDIRWMSEQYPPYNYVDDNGTPKGVTFDVLFKMFEKIGYKLPKGDVEFLPWARSYRTLQSDPHTALFSMTYTPEREKLFQFVGPIIPSKIGVIAKKSRGLSVASADDLNGLTIGAIRDDIGHQMLQSQGVKDGSIHLMSNTRNMLKMLQRDRVDAVAYGNDIALWNLKQMGADTSEYEVVYILKDGKMGYAFHKDTDPALLKKLQAALDQLKADGSVESISNQYLK
ncbi:transporter substrate-binding domain-containing protein [Marinobacteraceae bacterium S3BR75-40.1]